MASVRQACWCPSALNSVKHEFNAAINAGDTSPVFRTGLANVCERMGKYVVKSGALFLDVPFGSREEVLGIAHQLRKLHVCLAAVTAGAYACLAVSWLAYDYQSMHKAYNMLLPLLVYSTGCFEPGHTSWRINTGHAFQHLAAAMMGHAIIHWSPSPLRICNQDSNDPSDSLIGNCGQTMPHRTSPEIVGPLEPISYDDVVLCTHTSIDSLSLVWSMLQSWRGPASIAIFYPSGNSIDESRWALEDWLHSLGDEGTPDLLPLRQVVVSVVGSNLRSRTAYDQLYPANLLRRAALDAAVSEFVLIVDPGFVPAAGFYAAVAADSDLGIALRTVSRSAPTAFLVASFLTLHEYHDNLTFDGLHELVSAGSAVGFDAYVCPLCRPYAWQQLLLQGPRSLQFLEVGRNDLHHPAWLVPRKIMPRLPGFFHGLVTPRSGKAKTGWFGLPTGLKFSAEQLRANRVQILLLPNVFLHMSESSKPPSHHWEDLPDWMPLHYFFDVLFRHALATLPQPVNSTLPERVLVGRGKLIHVAPPSPGTRCFFTLQHGSDASLQLVVMASTILGSEGLQLLLSSVPWTVHAVTVGVKDYWAAAMAQLPGLLRTHFSPDALVALVDAYDVVLFPCDRFSGNSSVASEFASFGKDIVWAADTTCHPNRAVCRSCEQRYREGSVDLEACKAFPYLNGGCFMGKAFAVAEALEWMHNQGSKIGRDDQENKWHFYNNHFPDTVVLDHRQRIFTCFFGVNRHRYYVSDDCKVMDSQTSEQVCFAHANGGTKWEILAPLIRELERRGCRKPVPKRTLSTYAGMATPKLIWGTNAG